MKTHSWILLVAMVTCQIGCLGSASDFGFICQKSKDVLAQAKYYANSRNFLQGGGRLTETSGTAHVVHVNHSDSNLAVRMFSTATNMNAIESIEVARTNGCHSMFRFYPDGGLRRYEEYMTNSLSGFSMTFYTNRVVESCLRFTNGCFVGDAVWFAPDGSVKRIQSCTNEPVYEVRPPRPMSQDPKSSRTHGKQ